MKSCKYHQGICQKNCRKNRLMPKTLQEQVDDPSAKAGQVAPMYWFWQYHLTQFRKNLKAETDRRGVSALEWQTKNKRSEQDRLFSTGNQKFRNPHLFYWRKPYTVDSRNTQNRHKSQSACLFFKYRTGRKSPLGNRRDTPWKWNCYEENTRFSEQSKIHYREQKIMFGNVNVYSCISL